jgi:hypothetical protein
MTTPTNCITISSSIISNNSNIHHYKIINNLSIIIIRGMEFATSKKLAEKEGEDAKTGQGESHFPLGGAWQVKEPGRGARRG